MQGSAILTHQRKIAGMNKSTLLSPILLSLFCLLLLNLSAAAAPLAIKGANGRVVDFLGVRQANAEGVFVILNQAEGEIFVPWTVFDIPALQSDHPQIHRAYQRLRTPNVETVDLNLGIYANMFTLESIVAKASELAQKNLQLPVPPMSHFFDIDRFEPNYNGPLRNYYTTWQRRSEEYARNYERLLDDFFLLPSADSRRQTWELYSGNRDNVINTVIVDVHPPRRNVRFTLQHLVNEFANPNLRSRSLIIAYYRSYKEIYDELMGFFNELSAPFEENLVLGQQRDITMMRASLDRAKAHMARMAETAAPDAANFQRDFARFVEEWNLLPPDPRRR